MPSVHIGYLRLLALLFRHFAQPLPVFRADPLTLHVTIHATVQRGMRVSFLAISGTSYISVLSASRPAASITESR
jgi:hypothetical protein